MQLLLLVFGGLDLAALCAATPDIFLVLKHGPQLSFVLDGCIKACSR